MKALDHGQRRLHSLAGSLGHLDLLAPARNVDELGDRERRAVDAHQPTLRGGGARRQARRSQDFLIAAGYDGTVANARVWARMTDRCDCANCIYICADS
jgi:hypothetical protein